MREWCDKFKLGKSAFVKRDSCLLPLTEAALDADFFFDRESSSKDQEFWMGLVIEREFGGLLAMEDVQLPPPTVNDLANLLGHAMLRPLTGGDRQRPRIVHLRDRPQLRPRLEAMAAEGRAVDLDIHEWSRVLLALCGGRTKETTDRKRLLGMATRIANRLAEALEIDPPVFPMDLS